MNDVKIKLVKEIKQKDEYGVPKDVGVVKKEIYAKIDSVSSEEFFRAGVDKLRPAFRFTVYTAEYEGQRIVEYNNNRYSVYRSYQPTVDTIELYTSSKVGKNG